MKVYYVTQVLKQSIIQETTNSKKKKRLPGNLKENVNNNVFT